MALFYQHNINEGTRVGIWRIEEPESFFLEKVPVKREVSHPYKRLQHLAGRYLLRTLFNDFPMNEILVADTRKPYLENEKYHFSISHCGNYAAAIVSNFQRVGVDIELVTPRILGITQKFLHAGEQLFLQQWEVLSKVYLELTTIIWSAKEAIYKWYSMEPLDFKNDMRLAGPVTFNPNEWAELPFRFEKNTPRDLTIRARVFDPLVIAWVATD